MTAAEMMTDIRASIEEIDIQTAQAAMAYGAAQSNLTRLYNARIAKRDYLISVLMEWVDSLKNQDQF